MGSNSKGMEEVIKTLPTARRTISGIGLITGCFSNGVRQLAQIGIAPFGGCKTRAEPQQQEGQRYRGIQLNDLETNPKRAVLTQQNLKFRKTLCASET